MSGRTNSKFSTFSRSYQLRRLKEVKSRAECALWFLDMYGLKLDSLILKDDKEEQHGINFGSLSDSEKLSLEKYFTYWIGSTFLMHAMMSCLLCMMGSQSPT